MSGRRCVSSADTPPLRSAAPTAATAPRPFRGSVSRRAEQSRAERLWTARAPARLPCWPPSALAWLAGPLGLPGCTVGLPWWRRGGESPGSRRCAGDAGSIPGSETSPGGGNGRPRQRSCLGRSLPSHSLASGVHVSPHGRGPTREWPGPAGPVLSASVCRPRVSGSRMLPPARQPS